MLGFWRYLVLGNHRFAEVGLMAVAIEYVTLSDLYLGVESATLSLKDLGSVNFLGPAECKFHQCEACVPYNIMPLKAYLDAYTRQ